MSFQSLLFRLLLTFFIQFPLTLEAGNILIPSDSIHSNNNLTDSVNLIAVTSTSAGNNDSIPSLGINDAPLNSFKESLYEDSIIYALPPKKRFWRALGEGVFVNTVVWSADRWILGKDYYSKGWSTLKDNWKKDGRGTEMPSAPILLTILTMGISISQGLDPADVTSGCPHC